MGGQELNGVMLTVLILPPVRTWSPLRDFPTTLGHMRHVPPPPSALSSVRQLSFQLSSQLLLLLQLLLSTQPTQLPPQTSIQLPLIILRLLLVLDLLDPALEEFSLETMTLSPSVTSDWEMLPAKLTSHHQNKKENLAMLEE